MPPSSSRTANELRGESKTLTASSTTRIFLDVPQHTEKDPIHLCQEGVLCRVIRLRGFSGDRIALSMFVSRNFDSALHPD